MNNKITTWAEAYAKLGGGTSATPTKCPTKAQLISTFNGIDVTKLSGYASNQLVNYEDIAIIPNGMLFENEGIHQLELPIGTYKVLACGAGGSGANDGNRAGHASSGGNSGEYAAFTLNINSEMDSLLIKVGKGGQMTDSNTDVNGITGEDTTITFPGGTEVRLKGGIGGCSYDGGSAAGAGRNIRVDEQIAQGRIIKGNPIPEIISSWQFVASKIGGHSIRYSPLCDNSKGFSGEGPMTFSSFGVISKRYPDSFYLCSSGTGGLNTYSGERPYQNPGINGGGSSNQGDNSAPVSESHGKYPGCGGGGRNFTADHTGLGGNGADGMVIIIPQ